MIKNGLCALMILIFPAAVMSQIKYPETHKVTQVDDYHGTKIADPFRWLEDDNSAETKNWVQEQNNVTNSYLSSIPFRNEIRDRLSQLFNYTRFGIPFRKKEYYYYYKNDGLQNQAVLYRTEGLSGNEELVIDPNKLSQDGTTQLRNFELSKDGHYAAWGISRGGSDWEEFHVRDMTTMKDLTDTLSWVKVSMIGWQGHGFYYSRYPAPVAGAELSSENSNHQVWYHTVGTNQASDKLVFEDSVHLQRFHYVSTSEDERFAFLSIEDRGQGFNGKALWYMDCKSPEKKFVPLVKDVGESMYTVIDATEDGKILVVTNDSAMNSRIISIDPKHPERQNWKTVVKENQYALTDADVAGGRIFVQYLQDATSRVYEMTEEGRLIRQVQLPGIGSAEGFKGYREDRFVFYSFTSFGYPTTIFRYDIETGKSTVYRKPKLQFKPESYVTDQIFYRSKDGTRVPMFIVHRKGLKKDAQNPAILYGYGGFNISIVPAFTVSIIPWLEQGGIFAVANIRGGGEYGESWHHAGMLLKKQNVFDDFTAAAEYLSKNKYTNPEKLAIRGGSNGGLLVGTIINQRPDLMKVAIPEVGVMDMLRFHKFTIGWNWQAEYGSVANVNDFKNLYAYSPLHNIKSGVKYPATLVITADHDDRVVPAHSFKYAATLQEKYKGPNPILIRIDTNSGHGSSNIMKLINLNADIYSFILHNMGITWKRIQS